MMLTAVLIVRSMRKEEYAWYSLANNLQGSFAYITLAGVGTGLYAMGGARMGDRHAMGQIISAARQLRIRITLLTIPVLLPLVGYSLAKTQCPAWTIFGLLVCIVLMLCQQIAQQFAEFPFGLVGKYNVPQMGSLLAGGLRLILVGIVVAMHSFSAIVGMVAALVSGFVVLWLFYLPKSHHYVEPGIPPTAELSASFMRHMWNGLPIGIFYAAQSQFGMVVLTIAGTASSVAELGALTRIGMVMALPEAVVSKILTPRLASEPDLEKLRRIWLVTAVVGLLGGVGLALAVFMWRKSILWLLGPNYSKMENELTAYAGLLGFTFFVTSSSAIVQARGWIRHNWIRPVVILAFEAAVIPFCQVNRVEGIVVLFAASATAQLLMNAVLIYKGFQGRASV